jgi:hypothetical protein
LLPGDEPGGLLYADDFLNAKYMIVANSQQALSI